MKMSESDENIIMVGTYVIIKKHDYTKVHKISADGHVMLGKDQVNINNVIGKPFWSTFEMVADKSGKRVFNLKPVQDAESMYDSKNTLPSGPDNRCITDDGNSQKLSTEEIHQLQESGKSGKEIIGSLIENSKSFVKKTEYSQEKYIKKKERKYIKYLTICKPSIASLLTTYFKQDQFKIGGLRMDALSQFLSYSDVQSDGLYILYDSGSQGLSAAAVLNRIGSNTTGQLINLHPGNVPQTTAIQAMNFPKEQADRNIMANIYSFLRLHYQGQDSVWNYISKDMKIQNTKEQPEIAIDTKTSVEDNPSLKRKQSEPTEFTPAKKPRWFLETQRAVELVKHSKANSLLIIAKEHPLNIVNALLPFLGLSRPFVIFHIHREPLLETYTALKKRQGIINLKLYTNFLRSYQVLPDRTHPDILTSDTGGYILTGYLVES